VADRFTNPDVSQQTADNWVVITVRDPAKPPRSGTVSIPMLKTDASTTVQDFKLMVASMLKIDEQPGDSCLLAPPRHRGYGSVHLWQQEAMSLYTSRGWVVGPVTVERRQPDGSCATETGAGEVPKKSVSCLGFC